MPRPGRWRVPESRSADRGRPARAEGAIPGAAREVRFFDDLAARSLESEAAEALPARLLKFRDGPFAFLRHDGVAWNNNNAENAIKRFP
jgi:hypothetical protein